LKPRKQQKSAPIQLPWKFSLGIALLALLPYLPAVFHDFTFDDASIVANNPAVQEWGRWKKIFVSEYWPGGKAAIYRPITILSFALECAIHGPGPSGFHLVNILLHAGTSLLVLHVSTQIFGVGWAAVLSAGLFAVHPIHTEVVSGVVGRSELLSALLVLCACRIWMRRARGESDSKASYLAIPTLYFLSMLSKENVIVLPGLLLLWEIARPISRSVKTRILAILQNSHFWGLLAVSVLFLLVRAGALGGIKESFQPNPPFVENPLASNAPPQRLLGALAYQTHGLLLQLWPRPLLADYSYNTLPTNPGWIYPRAALFVLLCLGTLALWCRQGSTARNLAFAFSWYLVAVLPTSNLLFPIGTIFAERLFYFPSIGLCLAAGAIWHSIARKRIPNSTVPAMQIGGWTPGIAATVILVLMVSAGVRNLTWRNDLRLFTDTVAKAPLNVKARLWLGDARVRAGDPEAAIVQYRRASQILPTYGPAAANLMVPLQMLGRYSEAIEAGESALGLFSENNAALLYNLAMVYQAAGNPERFVDYGLRVINLDPRNSRMHFQLGKYYMQQTSNREAARRHLELALEAEPDMREAPLVRSMLRQLK
jgi:tetratricopeptide (TPR) repeat protein